MEHHARQLGAYYVNQRETCERCSVSVVDAIRVDHKRPCGSARLAFSQTFYSPDMKVGIVSFSVLAKCDHHSSSNNLKKRLFPQ